jgi:hypothetical protein
MSYDYQETEEEIIVDKGIATREMWVDYPHGREHISFEELVKACELRNRVPLVLDTDHNHHAPFTDGAKAIGYADLAPCPDKRGLTLSAHFRKTKLPPWLLEHIRQRETLPVSIYKFISPNPPVDREQRNVLFDHLMILTQDDPRCPIERCGVGVYDSKMTEKDQDPTRDAKGRFTPAEAAPSDGVSESGQPTDKEATAAPVEAAPEPPPTPEKDQEITDLKTRLEKAEAKVAAVRQPLIEELTQRGYQAQELNPLAIETLTKMVQQARSASTEGLPGTVPAPPPEPPKTLAEAREAEQQRFEKALAKRNKERFGDC